MQLINLSSMHLITPIELNPEKTLYYYSPVAISIGDILYDDQSPTPAIYSVEQAANIKQRSPVTIRSHKGLVRTKYNSTVNLREVPEGAPDYQELIDQVQDALGIPF